jgi:hypothetical protein
MEEDSDEHFWGMLFSLFSRSFVGMLSRLVALVTSSDVSKTRAKSFNSWFIRPKVLLT